MTDEAWWSNDEDDGDDDDPEGFRFLGDQQVVPVDDLGLGDIEDDDPLPSTTQLREERARLVERYLDDDEEV